MIEQGPDPAPAEGAGSAITTLVVSGKTDERIASLAAMLADWAEGSGRRRAAGRRGAHAQSSPGPPCQVRHGVRGDRTQAVAGLRALAAGRPRPGVVARIKGACGSGTVFVYSGQGSQWAGMGRRVAGRGAGVRAAVAELEPVFVEQVGFSLQRRAGRGRTGERHRAHPAGAGGHAAGVDRVVALLRGGTRCGDRAFDGGGDRGGGGRGADPGRGVAGDRDPFAVDVAAGRAGRDGAAGAGRRGHRGADRRLPGGDGGGVCLTARRP